MTHDLHDVLQRDLARADLARVDRARADLPTRLREAAADRVPLALRSPAVPWRAAVIAVVVALLLGTAMLARARAAGGADDAELPPRPSTAASTAVSPASEGVSAVASMSGRTAGPDGSSPPAGAARLLAGQSGGTAPAEIATPGQVVVHVVGRVRRPGLVRLPAGSRVWDAVAASGGAAPGSRPDRLNLARPLVDGEQVSVPGPDDPVPLPPGAAAGAAPGAGQVVAGGAGVAGNATRSAGSGSRVDLNTATEAELDTLPGVGPVLAGRILAWRAQHGRFTRAEELGEVTGIGAKLLAQLIPLVRV